MVCLWAILVRSGAASVVLKARSDAGQRPGMLCLKESNELFSDPAPQFPECRRVSRIRDGSRFNRVLGGIGHVKPARLSVPVGRAFEMSCT